MLTDRSQLGSTDQPCRAWRRVLSIIISRQMRNVRNPSSKLYWVALLCIHRLAMSQRTWVQLWSALRLIDWCVRIPNQPLHLCAFTCHVHLYKHTSETPSVKRTCETSSLTIAWLSLYIYIGRSICTAPGQRKAKWFNFGGSDDIVALTRMFHLYARS